MFISPAYAQTTGGGFGGIESFLPIILIFVVFYFLLIRPQQKKQKQHRDMLSAIRRGDRVVTGGGGCCGALRSSGRRVALTVTLVLRLGAAKGKRELRSPGRWSGGNVIRGV